jgi:hypothetical protein
LKEHFDTAFKILLLAVLVWIALEIRGIYFPSSIDAQIYNATGTSLRVESSR